MFAYSDQANRLVLESAAGLPEHLLDAPMDIGPAPGSLRRILIHIANGEKVWFARQSGDVEHPWPAERVHTPLSEIAAELSAVAAARDRWLGSLADAQLLVVQPYRDSRGKLYRASLLDMLLQGLIHSVHHRAQAVNAIRRLGGVPPELDYMVHHRQEAK